jgi:glycine/serine hydroxymethyltransferase
MFDYVTYSLEHVDHEIWSIIKRKNDRQEDHIELIAFFKDAEVRATAHLIADVLDNPRDEAKLVAVRNGVRALTSRSPVYR